MPNVLINLQDLIGTAAGTYLTEHAHEFQGETGARGPVGDKGDTKYLWVRYADNGSGSGISSSPVGKTYVGLAANKDTAVASDMPADYDWILVKGRDGDAGDQGQPGVKGDQGISVHHMKGTNTTDLEGDFGTFGEWDTYTFYGDAAETINLGYFTVRNGMTPEQMDQDGYMRRDTYDLNGSGVVDNAEALGGKSLAQVEQDRDAAILAAQLSLGTNYTVTNNTEKAALSQLTEGDKIFVTDDGDGKWAQYWVTAITDGQGITSTFQLVMDEDTYLNANTKESIKAVYESNLNTNAFTDAEQTKVGYVTVTQAVDLDTLVSDTAANSTHSSSTGADHTFIDQDVTSTGTPRFDSVQLNGGTGTQGLVSWNADEETLDVVLDGAVLQVGQEFIVNVRNATGSTIPDGTPLMYTGSVGNSGRILVAPMNGTSAGNTTKLLGFATTEILNGFDGKATMFGKVRGIDTTGTPYGEVWTNGDTVYISPTIVGALTNVEPTATQVDIAVAVVVNAAVNGTLFARALPDNHNEISLGVQGYIENRLAIVEW